MYIRECVTTNKKNNTRYVTHRLVEAYRVNEDAKQKVKQRVILHLGTLDLPKSEWPKLAKALEARLAGQSSLFEGNSHIATIADKAMEHYEFTEINRQEKAVRQEKCEMVCIDMQSVENERYRSLGPELVANAFWQRLGFDGLLEQCGLTLVQQALAKAVIIGRLIKPGSELSTWNWLHKQTENS